MESCCTVRPTEASAPTACPSCGRPGREVDRITLKALLRSEALARMSAPEHRFCATTECPVVYFGKGEVFERADITVPVFQKEAPGHRTVCYCFAISEDDLRHEIVATGRSTAAERITSLVGADRCACEVRNPQGSCCLGNVAAAVKAANEAVQSGGALLVLSGDSPSGSGGNTGRDPKRPAAEGGVMLRTDVRLVGLLLAGVLAAAPAPGEVQSVTFKTTNAKVGFL